MTLIVAHRGDPSVAPESTLPAFEAAVALKVDMVEFDVHQLADGALVVMHDATVDRCTDGSGRLAEMTLPQVRRLDAGSWFGPEFAATQVPTMAEALEAIPPPVLLNIHLKTVPDESWRFEAAVLARIEDAGAAPRALVVHDDLPTLNRLRALAPQLRYCLLPDTPDGFAYINRAAREGFCVLQPGHGMMSAGFCRAVHDAEMTANVFYADDARTMAQYIRWGIDGILTNRPALLAQVRAQMAAER
ncbi:MAG: glycerophosphodiester phosphodiesterase [Armatimonadota bacterium]